MERKRSMKDKMQLLLEEKIGEERKRKENILLKKE